MLHGLNWSYRANRANNSDFWITLLGLPYFNKVRFIDDTSGYVSFKRVSYRGSDIPQTAIFYSFETANRFRFLLKTDTAPR